MRKILAAFAVAALCACAHPGTVVDAFAAASASHASVVGSVERAAAAGVDVQSIREAERVAEQKLVLARVAVERYLATGSRDDLAAAKAAVDEASKAVTAAIELAVSLGVEVSP